MGKLKTLEKFERYNNANKKVVSLEKKNCGVVNNNSNKSKILLSKSSSNSIHDKESFFEQINSDYKRLKLNGEQWKEELIERERLSEIIDSILFDEEEVDWEELYE